MKNHYITAVSALLKDEHKFDDVVGGLKKTLKHRGHEQLLPSILRGVERTFDGSTKRAASRLTLARKGDDKKLQNEIEAAFKTLGVKEADETIYDENIIGGAVIEANHGRVDMSYRRALTDLYHSITK